MEQRRYRWGGSAGDAKIWVFLALLLIGGIFALSKFGPVYGEKWELEDKMEDIMVRLSRIGEEGMFDELQTYVDEKKLNFNVYENCKFEGDVGEAATWTCTYSVRIGLPKYEKHTLKAEVKSPKIPTTSF